MKKYLFLAILALGCSKDNDVDVENPVVVADYPETFPKACQVLERGKTYTFQALFTDNQELGSYTFDIHNDFDHHSHGSEGEECEEGEEKTPVNPFVFIKTAAIPDGQKQYLAKVEVQIPADVDTGDYHLSIKLTDKAGSSSQHRKGFKIQ